MFFSTRTLMTLASACVLADAVALGVHRRQDGTVPPGTISDCTYFYTAQSGDTCASIANDWGITSAQFLDYNPSVKSDCSGLVIGDSYCVEENYGKGPASTSSSVVTTSAPTTTASAAPSPMQTGIASNCQRYYKVQSGDTCSSIVDQFHEFSLQDFYSWNPAVGSQCGNLLAGYYVCIGVPGTPTTPVSASTTPSATGVSPTQSGIASDCVKYYQAQSGDSCSSIANSYGTFSVAQFEQWNPAVGSNCGSLYAGYYYCVAVPGTPTAAPTMSTTATTASGPSPTQSGIASDCLKYYLAQSGDSCSSISMSFGTFTVADFEKWNPAVGSNCGSLFAGYYYCVAVPGTPTAAPTTSTTATSASGPSPTQSGIVADCQKYYQAQSGDSCSTIADSFGTFTVAQFERWNPAVGSNCASLWAGYYYCVAVPGTPTTPISTSTSTTAPAASPTTNGPQPQQPGIVSSCNAYYKVSSGDSCYTIEQQFKISSSQFLSWNTGIHSDCGNLYLDYYVCVGVH